MTQLGEIKQTGYFKNDATERSYGPSYNYKREQSGSGAVRGTIPGDMSAKIGVGDRCYLAGRKPTLRIHTRNRPASEAEYSPC